MNMQNAEALAELLAAARQDNHQIQHLPEQLVPDTTESSYVVNELVAKKLGWEQCGWKIAGTTEFVRKRLNLDSPIYGRTFTRHKHLSPVTMKLDELLDPLLECEFFVTLSKDFPVREEPWTMDEILDSIATVHAGIEVAECRFPTSALPSFTAVLADGSASGQYVFGDLISDWKDGLSNVSVRLTVDGVERRTGTGSDVMGDPIAPLLWLVEERRKVGESLKAGAVISTGSMTGMLPVKGPCNAKVQFGDIAEVQIDFI